MKITKEEFMSLYGGEVVSFTSYYKFEFTYTGVTEGGLFVQVSEGGCSDDIYRVQVNTKELPVACVQPDWGVVKDLEGNVVHSFEDRW